MQSPDESHEVKVGYVFNFDPRFYTFTLLKAEIQNETASEIDFI